MDEGEIVKTCQAYMKHKAQGKISQITFNASEALLLAPQMLFNSSMYYAMLRAKKKHNPESYQWDPCLTLESFQDPEDILEDILAPLTTSTVPATKNASNMPAKASGAGEDSVNGTPSASVRIENDQSELNDDPVLPKLGSEHFYSQMKEVMDLDEMICRSISQVDN